MSFLGKKHSKPAKAGIRRSSNNTLTDDIPKEHNYDKDETNRNLKSFHELIKQQKIVLQIGAGLSMDYGLNNWKSLVLEILGDKYCFKFEKNEIGELEIEKEFETLLPNLDSLQWMSLAEQKIKEKGGDFKTILHEKLYNKKEEVKENTKYKLIIEKWIKTKKIEHIVTYNFDNFFQIELENSQILFHTLSDEKIIQSVINSNDLKLYHVHGFLPKLQSVDLNQNSQITFTEKEYYNQYSNPFNWQNQVQLNSLIHYTNLFIGASLDDSNMRRLLSLAKSLNGKQHYLICTRNYPKKIHPKNEDDLYNKENEVLNFIKSEYMKTLNVNIIFIDNHAFNQYETIIK